jgi:serum/glucocorticoid-regulated kinase 2
MEPFFQDNLNWNSDPDISKLIGKETIYYTNKVHKLNAILLKQERVLILTDQSLYNIHNKKVKRQMKYEEMLGITFSIVSNEFVIHADKGYDFHFSTPDKIMIIYIIAKCYEKFMHKPIILCQVKDRSLRSYVTTKKDKKKDSNNSRLNDKNIIDTLTFIIDNEPVQKNQRSYTEMTGQFNNLALLQENENKIKCEIYFSKDSKTKEFEDFKIIKIIGRAISGKVFLAQNKINEEYYALKSIEKSYFIIEPPIIENLGTFAKNLSIPFLINIDFCFETDDRIYFFFPYIQGEQLFYYINKMHNLDEEKIRFYSGIIGLSFDYLINNKIQYKSFSSKNILIDKDGYLKLLPFHICSLFKIRNMDKNKYLNSIEKYKNEYYPPELFIASDTENNKSAYWWNLGVLIFEMIYSIPPFFTDKDSEIKNMVINNELKFPKNVSISETLKDLLNKLLNKKPEERLGYQNGFEDIKKHEFFKDYNFEELLSKKIEAPYKPIIDDILESNKKIEPKFTYEDLDDCNISKSN